MPLGHRISERLRRAGCGIEIPHPYCAGMMPRLILGALLAFQAVPYSPQPIVTGGIVIPLFPADSPLLKKERLGEAEVFNMQASVPGRIQSIVRSEEHTSELQSHS